MIAERNVIAGALLSYDEAMLTALSVHKGNRILLEQLKGNSIS